MIPALIYLLIKKLRKRNAGRITTKFFYRKNQIAFTFLVLLILMSCILFAQQTLTYKVVRDGNEIGWMKLDKTITGNTTLINMVSEMKVRMIFLFTIVSSEYAEFRDGKMIHSYVFRKMNGNIKANKHLRLQNDGYEVENSSGKEKLTIEPITFNILSMYFGEPAGLSKIYSNTQQDFAAVEKIKNNDYKLHLPDGNCTEYYYNNGICTKVKINHNLYSAEFILNQ